MTKTYKAISLFSGAGGMDVGFSSAGVEVVWANEIDKDACDTYEANNVGTILTRGDLREKLKELEKYKDMVDVVFGGPPCQGFSVAGKMDPNDERSKLVWEYLNVVDIVRPKIFVLENVKALGSLEKWSGIREKFIDEAKKIGYDCSYIILNASDFGVPQNRERVFFIGILDKHLDITKLENIIYNKKKKKVSVREAIYHLGPAGSDKNPLTCTAIITLAKKPIIRKSPYAGMMFNGSGRPLQLDNVSNTLSASMGGNKTPIVDELLLYGKGNKDWIAEYHNAIINNLSLEPYKEIPNNLRRLTIKEAALLQSFPENYIFKGSKSAIYRQIGNAVPCLLAEVVCESIIEYYEEDK